MLRFIGLSLLLAFSVPLQAQYHLAELGAGIQAGPTLSALESADGIGTLARATIFYTHFICGKPYGYQLEAGPSYLSQRHTLAPGQGITTNRAGGHLAALFKLRRKNYHRPREAYLLAGPRLELLGGGDEKAAYLVANQPEQATLEQPGLQLAASLSAWYRLPMSKHNSWLLGLGADYALLGTDRYRPTATASRTGAPLLRLWMGVGLTLWNNR